MCLYNEEAMEVVLNCACRIIGEKEVVFKCAYRMKEKKNEGGKRSVLKCACGVKE